MSATARRDHIRERLADRKLPGALEAVDDILAKADNATLTAREAIERLLDAQITLRNNRRLPTAMRSSRLPAIKTLGPFARRLRVLSHPALLLVDEIGYLPVSRDGAVLLFPLIKAH